MKIAIVGKGRVGTAMGTGLGHAGHEIKFGHRDPKEPVVDAAKWGSTIILAVPHTATANVARTIGSLADEKTLIDVTNAINQAGELDVGFSTSAAEELQKMLPRAHVVKGFNTVFAQNHSTGRLGANQLTAFIAGDDSTAKQTAMQLAKDIGFDPVDSGPLKAARYLEPMAMLLMTLGFQQKMGLGIGLKLVKG